jgi:hypothetical protein
MSKQTYYEKLRDPRWQRKRLEIMERDNFTCMSCGNKEKTLNVHHKTYRKNADPWDYPDENFVTYCKYCHEEMHMHFDEIKMSVKDSYAAMILSCLASCDHDALEHMNSIRLVVEDSLMTCDVELNNARIQGVEHTIAMLQQETLKANNHNAKLLKSGIEYKDPFGSLDAMIDREEATTESKQ